MNPVVFSIAFSLTFTVAAVAYLFLEELNGKH